MYKPILATVAFVIGLASVGIVSTTVVQAEVKQGEILVDQGPGLMPAPAKDVATFKDVTENMWSYDDIMYLSSQNLIKGYGDGRYGPKDNVTRGQVAALIHRYLLTQEGVQVATKNTYKDIKGNMYEDAILIVSGLGIMEGYPDRTFKPNGVITRAEMARVMTTTFGLNGDDGFNAEKNSYDFWDMDSKHWANDAIRALYANGLTFGNGNNNFNPEGKVTREQCASFLNRAIHLDRDFVPKPIPVKPSP